MTRPLPCLLALLPLAGCSTLLGFEPLSLDPNDGAQDAASADGDATALDAGPGDALDATDAADAPGISPDGACTGDLTRDSKNCGRCGHDCVGGSCEASACQAAKLADGLATPEGLAADDTSVYVAERGADRILKFAKSEVPSACTTAPLPAGCVLVDDPASALRPVAVATDGVLVVWANAPPDNAHEIRACPRAGCGGATATTIATLDVNAFWHNFGVEYLPLALSIRNGRVFWPENSSGAIRGAQLDGGALVTLLNNGTFAPVDIAVSDDWVYFTDDTNQHAARVQAVPLDGGALDGGAVKVIASTAARPFGIASSDAGALYFTIPRIGQVGDGLVQTAPTAGIADGGAPVGALATSQDEPTSVMVDERNVYWVQAGSDSVATGMVVYCPLAGCPSDGPIVLARQQAQPRHLAQDDRAIYWSNEGLTTGSSDGQVWKIAKP